MASQSRRVAVRLGFHKAFLAELLSELRRPGSTDSVGSAVFRLMTRVAGGFPGVTRRVAAKLGPCGPKRKSSR